MVISIKQDNLTVSVELDEDGFDKSVSCEELMLEAYDIIGRVYSDKAVVKAYYRTDPDRMAERERILENPYFTLLASFSSVRLCWVVRRSHPYGQFRFSIFRNARH